MKSLVAWCKDGHVSHRVKRSDQVCLGESPSQCAETSLLSRGRDFLWNGQDFIDDVDDSARKVRVLRVVRCDLPLSLTSLTAVVTVEFWRSPE